MHSTKELTSDMFSLRVDDREAGIPELFPGFDDRDRLGIVVREPGGSFGASVLTLATITAFYSGTSDASARPGTSGRALSAHSSGDGEESAGAFVTV